MTHCPALLLACPLGQLPSEVKDASFPRLCSPGPHQTSFFRAQTPH